MQVERFFHIRPMDESVKRKFNGCTVLVRGDTDYVGQVELQTSFCSRKDPFCRRDGRIMAIKNNKVKIVALRYLPNELARIEDQIHGYELDNANDFLFSMRYFLPKE